MPTINGVLLYTCIQTPTFKYQDKINKEYKVSVVVDEDTADTWEESFPKQSAKTIKTSEFEKEYKISAPFPEAKKQYIITLKRDAQYKDGNPLPEKMKPKVFLNTGTSEDGSIIMENITADKLVGNGSVGAVSYETTENDYGTFAKLRNIRVDTLVEYKASGGDGDDDLGVVSKKSVDNDLEEAPTAKKTVAAKEEKPARKVRSVKDIPDDDPDDQSPF